MKKVVFNGTPEQFGSSDFEKLMNEMNAEKISGKYNERNSDFCDSYEKKEVYFSKENNLTIVYSEEPNFSDITLYGSPKKIGIVKTKVLEAIASIPFDPEGLRL